MHFTKTALAAALVAAGTHASADIQLGNNPEMVLVVWSAGVTKSSYVLDLGLTYNTAMSTFFNAGAAFSKTLNDPLLTNSGLLTASDTRWAVATMDTVGDPAPDSDGVDNLAILTTVRAGSAFSAATPGMNNDGLQNAGAWADWISLINSYGTNGSQANGSMVCAQADGACYFLDQNSPQGQFGSSWAYNQGNAIGTSSSFYRLSSSDFLNTLKQVTVQRFATPAGVAGTWSFNGTTVAYSVPAAVPEPSIFLMLAAGLACVGFVARRRAA